MKFIHPNILFLDENLDIKTLSKDELNFSYFHGHTKAKEYINKIKETKDGIDIECGASAYIIANRIQYFMILEENNNKVA